jgi:sodium/hydrogen antiporter
VLSILAHSSTDVVVARAFDDQRLPGWRQRLDQARRRLRRDRGESPPGETDGRDSA